MTLNRKIIERLPLFIVSILGMVLFGYLAGVAENIMTINHPSDFIVLYTLFFGFSVLFTMLSMMGAIFCIFFHWESSYE